MEIKQADKAANKNFDTFLTEMRATAQVRPSNLHKIA